MKKKTKKQLEGWMLENFNGKYVSINNLTEDEAKAQLLEHCLAMDKMMGNLQKNFDLWEKLGY